jgi:peptidoglycan/xylan/chitin deacetylase (PgdA/CDA1 family)
MIDRASGDGRCRRADSPAPRPSEESPVWLVVDYVSDGPPNPPKGGRVKIVTFHGVGEPGRPLDDGESDVWLSVDGFTRMLDAVAARTDVRITIDDANASDFEVVMPALLRRGRIGWFFLPAGRIGEPGFVDAAQARDLVATGMVVGSHGMRHRPWSGLSDTELRSEIVDSKHLLEDIVGRPVYDAACPFGAYDRRALETLREAGYVHVYTSDRGVARPDRWMLPRNTVHVGDTPDDVVCGASRDPGMFGTLARAARMTVKRWR